MELQKLINTKNSKLNMDCIRLNAEELKHLGFTASQIERIFALKNVVDGVKENDLLLRDRTRQDSVTSPAEITQRLLQYMRFNSLEFNKECFLAVCLDVRSKIITVKEISRGILTASLVHPREVFGVAIKNNSASIIVAHNHPSGEAEPSEDDIKITRRLHEAGKVLAIELLDHVIFTETGSYVSLKERGVL